jgi:bifunctional non-homologous end joining protein LigD
MVMHDEAGLVALAQTSALELHINGARVIAPTKPDRLVFDLDPDEGLAWDHVAGGALLVRDRLTDIGLVGGFLQSTGGKGLHIVVPVEPTTDWEQAKAFTQRLAQELAAEHPTRFTAKQTKAARRGRIYIDYVRNSRGASAIAPYSTRARPGAPVALPMDWQELGAGQPLRLSIAGVPRRIAAIGNPWSGYFSTQQHLP